MQRAVFGAAVAMVVMTGCGDPFALTPASRTNTVDTLQIYAVNGTPLTLPSAYLLATKTAYRLGVDALPFDFDFLYRIDPVNGPELVPFSAISTNPPSSGRSGYLETTRAFDDITIAEQSGYVTDQPVALSVGQVFYLRSGVPNGCYLLIPYYAKLEIIEFDSANRSVRFRILVNNNCGYRALTTGLPEE